MEEKQVKPTIKDRVDTNPNGMGITWIAIALAGINLLIMNDLTTLLQEESLLLKAPTGFSLPFWQVKWLSLLGIQHIFWFRTGSVLLLTLALYFFYYYGKQLFGKVSLRATLLVLLSSPLFISLSKWVSADTWLLLALVANTLPLLYLLKRPSPLALVIYFISIPIGFLTAPVSFGIYGLTMHGTLFFFLPKKQPAPRILLAGLIWAPLSTVIGLISSFEAAAPYLLISWSGEWRNIFFLLPFLTLFPWLGFLGGGLIELIRNFRKGEEASIILGSWLLAGLASGSAGVILPLALITGRQVVRYFIKGYPYATVVRGIHIIGLVIVFFGSMWLMMKGFLLYGGAGFRLAMIPAAVYWILSFSAIFSLFLFRARLAWSLFAGSGLLVTFLSWALWNPIAEQYRGFPKQVAEKLEALGGEVQIEPLLMEEWPALEWYLQEQGVRYKPADGSNAKAKWHLCLSNQCDSVNSIETYRPYLNDLSYQIYLKSPVEENKN